MRQAVLDILFATMIASSSEPDTLSPEEFTFGTAGAFVTALSVAIALTSIGFSVYLAIRIKHSLGPTKATKET